MKKLLTMALCSLPMALIACGGTAIASVEELNIHGQFLIKTTESGIQIVPQVEASKDTSLRYKVSINKCGTAGTSRHTNSGHVTLVAHELKNISSTISFPNFSASDFASMTLELMQGRESIATFSKNYPDSKGCGK